MDCIPYINDLLIEIDVLKRLKENVVKPENVEIISQQIEDKQMLVDKCIGDLSSMQNGSIEYRLYLKILEGKTPTRAVKEIADENYERDITPADVSNIWKKYYKKIKKYIQSPVICQ